MTEALVSHLCVCPHRPAASPVSTLRRWSRWPCGASSSGQPVEGAGAPCARGTSASGPTSGRRHHLGVQETACPSRGGPRPSHQQRHSAWSRRRRRLASRPRGLWERSGNEGAPCLGWLPRSGECRWAKSPGRWGRKHKKTEKRHYSWIYVQTKFVLLN